MNRSLYNPVPKGQANTLLVKQKPVFQHQIYFQKALYTESPHTLSSLTPSATFKREKI